MRKNILFYLMIYYINISLNILMIYYQRYKKIIPTTNKNLPLSNLLFNYTGDEFEPANFKGLYNGLTANECIERFSNSLYKYIDKYIQNDNIIIIDNFDEYKKKLKNICNRTLIGDKLYIHQNNSISIYEQIDPKPLEIFGNTHTNKYIVKQNIIILKNLKFLLDYINLIIIIINMNM